MKDSTFEIVWFLLVAALIILILVGILRTVGWL